MKKVYIAVPKFNLRPLVRREWEIIQLRHGERMTYIQIAHQLNRSTSYVRDIERAGMRKLMSLHETLMDWDGRKNYQVSLCIEKDAVIVDDSESSNDKPN